MEITPLPSTYHSPLPSTPPAARTRIRLEPGPHDALVIVRRSFRVQRTIVLMAGDLGLTRDDIPNVRKAMKSFVDREMQTTDLAAVMTASGGMRAMGFAPGSVSLYYAKVNKLHEDVPSRMHAAHVDFARLNGGACLPLLFAR